jgi:hypothetical protein
MFSKLVLMIWVIRHPWQCTGILTSVEKKADMDGHLFLQGRVRHQGI